jgi:hypothetical protein
MVVQGERKKGGKAGHLPVFLTGNRDARVSTGLDDRCPAMQTCVMCSRSLLATLVLFVSSLLRLQAADAIQTAGDILQVVLPLTAGGLTLGYSRSEGNGKVADFLGRAEDRLGLGYRDTQGTVQLAETLGLTLGTTYVLKYAVNETRPNGGSQSFPSGHTSISFSAAEFMRKRYGWGYGIPAYGLASFVGYSRVEAREHYAHDVVAGAAIGIFSSYIFTRPYKGWHVEAEAGGRYYVCNDN